MEEFSKPQYRVDVLKVEVPINAEFVEGSSVYKGQKAYTREEALQAFPRGRGDGDQTVHLPERRREQRAVHRIAGHGRRGGHGLLRRAVRPRHLEGRHSGLRQAGAEGAGGVAAAGRRAQHQRGERALQSACPWYTKLGMAP